MSKERTETHIRVVQDTMALERQILRATWQNHEFMGQRKGQALMNALHSVAPELYDIISGTDDDCFYDDGKIDQTFGVLGFVRKVI